MIKNYPVKVCEQFSGRILFLKQRDKSAVSNIRIICLTTLKIFCFKQIVLFIQFFQLNKER